MRILDNLFSELPLVIIDISMRFLTFTCAPIFKVSSSVVVIVDGPERKSDNFNEDFSPLMLY